MNNNVFCQHLFHSSFNSEGAKLSQKPQKAVSRIIARPKFYCFGNRQTIHHSTNYTFVNYVMESNIRLIPIMNK